MDRRTDKKRTVRGNPCSLEQSAAKYGLADRDAQRLFRISARSEIDLEVLMSAKGIAQLRKDPCE